MDNKNKKTHEELKGFDIKVDPFGQMETNISIDDLNAFLNENVEDKRLNSKKEEE